jgi:MFS family permease
LAVIFTDRQERARAFGVYGAIAASGGAIGLLLGGLLTQYVDWRWCLYVNVPIALCAALAARVLVPSARRARSDSGASQFDVPGLVLGSASLITLVYACAQTATRGWTSPLVLSLLALGALLFGLFLRQESHAPAPLLPLSIVRDRERGAAYLSALLAVAGMFGAFLFLTYELQAVLGFSPVEAGLAFLPMSLSSLVAGTLIAPRLIRRIAPRLLIAPGFVLAALGMGVLTQLQPDSTYLSGVLPAEILLGLGVASVMMPASILATSRVDPRIVGVASAVLNSAQQVGASLGTAILNSVAALATAAVIGGSRADALVHGYATAALLAAVFLAIGAVATWLMLSPRAQSAGQPAAYPARPSASH